MTLAHGQSARGTAAEAAIAGKSVEDGTNTRVGGESDLLASKVRGRARKCIAGVQADVAVANATRARATGRDGDLRNTVTGHGLSLLASRDSAGVVGDGENGGFIQGGLGLEVDRHIALSAARQHSSQVTAVIRCGAYVTNEVGSIISADRNIGDVERSAAVIHKGDGLRGAWGVDGLCSKVGVEVLVRKLSQGRRDQETVSGHGADDWAGL